MFWDMAVLPMVMLLVGSLLSLTATPGYDDQTGLGSPDGAAYVAALAAHH